MAISLASLDGYRDGPEGFMKQLRLAESFLAISLTFFEVITMDLKDQ